LEIDGKQKPSPKNQQIIFNINPKIMASIINHPIHQKEKNRDKRFERCQRFFSDLQETILHDVYLNGAGRQGKCQEPEAGNIGEGCLWFSS